MAIASIAPVRLDAARAPDAAAVLARAFHENPGFVWVVPDPEKRAPKLRWFMQVGLKIGLRMGEVYTTPERVDGAAIWLPPGNTNPSTLSMLSAGFIAGPVRLGVGPFMTFMRVISHFEHLHKRDMPGDHWYLFILGVDPPRWRQGIGSALIRPVLDRADAAGLPCYLETDKPEDVAFYERNGFVVKVKENMPGGGPPFWTMIRPPRA